MSAFLHIDHVSKVFTTQKGEQFAALKDIDFTVSENEFVSIVGPSGCGKSTLLRIIAGLEQCSSGQVHHEDRIVSKPSRTIGMVFQHYSLLPWLNVIDNIALGLEFSGMKTEARREVASGYLAMIGMSDFAQSYPYELSGGMQQRVAIARALANDPDILLMDEPFGALDAYTRILLQRELLHIWQQKRKTILFVTHSVDEAVFLSDRIIVMHYGEIDRFIPIEMSRPRQRDDVHYAKLSAEILAMLEAGDSDGRFRSQGMQAED